MPLKLMYITNDVHIAKVAESSGVDRIFVDLEILGKEKRQKNLNSVISKHNIQDVDKIKSELTKAELLVRVNPIHKNSKDEINNVIERGADIVMLPMFKKKSEVEMFIKYVDGRAKTNLLLENKQAYENLDDILTVSGIDEIHIGLNDLHLSYNMKFMFEPLANGIVEDICNMIDSKNIPYGFGGIARIGKGLLPAEKIIMEHYRLGSSAVILSRSFCNTNNANMEEIKETFESGIREIRNFENSLEHVDNDKFVSNKKEVIQIVNSII